MDEGPDQPKPSLPWWTWFTLLLPLAFLAFSGWMLHVAQDARRQDAGRAIALGKLEALERALVQIQQGSIVLWRSAIASDSVERWRELYRNYRNQVKQLDGNDASTREVMDYLLRVYSAVGRTERIRQQLLSANVSEEEGRLLEAEFRSKIDVALAELKAAMLKLRLANATADNLPLWTGFAIASAGLALITAVVLLLLARQTGRLTAAEVEMEENWREVRAVELRCQAILDAAPDAFLLADSNGIVQAANLGAQSLSGYAASELVGRSLSSLFPALAGKSAPSPAPGEAAEGGGWSEAEIRRRDGSAQNLDVAFRKSSLDGSPATIVLMRPSGKGRVEAMLRSQRDFLNAVMETTDLMLAVLDERGLIVSINGAFERKTGLTLAQLRGKSFQKSFTVEPMPGRTPRFPAPSGLSWITREEERRRVLWHGADLLGKGGSIQNSVVLGVDLTEYLAALAPPAAAISEAVAEERGKLAVRVAQTLGDALTTITGYGELLLDSLPAGDPARRDVGEILAASQRAGAVAKRLLAFSQRDLLRVRPVDVNARIEALRSRLCEAAGPGVILTTELDRDLEPAQADPERLDELLLILARNAGEAMPGGGALTVRTSRARSSDGTQWVSVSVRDTGTGIDTEIQKRLFEPFFTTKDPRKSLGLGLATARGLMAQLGGYIRIETAPGAGTKVSLLFPPAGMPAGNAPVGTGVAGAQA